MLEPQAELDAITRAAHAVQRIPVYISYEIIRLFSEGLYQSPHKAIEELVSNGYDAGASRVHILLPQAGEDGSDKAGPIEDYEAADSENASETVQGDSAEHDALEPLWVIDNGHGMDAHGFELLWRVADSTKADYVGAEGERSPIGQFGIGKLASYVLAWRLTHISKANGVIRFTTMNFREIQGRRQSEGADPLDVELLELDEEDARRFMAEVEERDPVAWGFLFGDDAAPTWTVAVLSDFKNLYDSMRAGLLGWVLRTGLPLASEFQIWLDGEALVPAKESRSSIAEFAIGDADDSAADKLELERAPGGGVFIEGIDGAVTGRAVIFERRLTEGKSDQYGRSNGFFIRVRGRVINLEDELFGLDVLNHSVWSRFFMEVEADGLRDHLLSSREGVRENEAIRTLRKYLLRVFNRCRSAYEDWDQRELVGLDIQRLLSDAPSLFVTEPMLHGVQRNLELGGDSFYLAEPEVEYSERETWLGEFEKKVQSHPFEDVIYEETGEYDRALRYLPETRTLVINTDHPFISKLIAKGRNRSAATLFGSSEVLLDGLLHDHGVSRSVVLDLLRDRDRILRLLAGQATSTAEEVMHQLTIANRDETALEVAVGMAFRVLGFEYERRGRNQPGPDGVLYARLGRDVDTLADYKLVYDAKQSNSPTIASGKVTVGDLESFRVDEGADFAFFAAVKYAGEGNDKGRVNKKVAGAIADGRKLTLLKLEHLRKIVELHYRFGVTLTRLRSLFETAHTVPQVDDWVAELEQELLTLEPRVPLRLLLEALEATKHDELARPSVVAARVQNIDQLGMFKPEKLTTALQAMESLIGKRWLEVEASGEVRLHATVEQIMTETERQMRTTLGMDALDFPATT